MSHTDSRATVRELKADLERLSNDRNAVRDRRDWGTFASRKTVHAFKRAGNKTRRYRNQAAITRDLADN
jgi:outer membrane murein-binding lipoprotein Lpp